MAHSWHYPRWRRALMQITMWLLLGGTVGLAAWVSNDRNNQAQAPLTQALHIGRLELKLPGNWVFPPVPGPPGRRVAVVPGNSEGASFVARIFPVDPDRTPADFLCGVDGLLKDELPVNDDDTAATLTTLNVGDRPGVLLKLIATAASPAEADRWLVCGIFPDIREALVLEIDVPHSPGSDDPATPLEQDLHAQLLRRIAASVRLVPGPPVLQAVPPSLPPV